jgi:hypothetical protein
MEGLHPHDGSFPARDGPAIAVVLCRTPHSNLHIGLLYKGAGTGHALHLGWEDYLSDRWDWGGVLASPRVEPELLFAAARMCRRIWRIFSIEQRFPYGLKFEGTTFDVTGRLALASNTRGLTCATFVLAALRSVGVLLIDDSDWPIRMTDDLAFLEFIRKFASQSHYAVLQREIEEGVKRVRPEEVTAACLLPPPTTFPEIRPVADRVVERLDGRPNAASS